MNNLSWLLYFAGVCGNLQGVLIFAAVLLGIATLGFTIAWACSMESYNAEEHAMCGKVLRWTIPGLIIAALLSALMPSERTVYLIAGSEMGETVLKSETGQKAQAALNRLLDTIGTDDKKNDENKQDK